MSDTQPLTVTTEVLAALQAPTPPTARKTRAGAKRHQGECGRPCQQPHMMLDYVDARYVQAVLDSEVGPGNWQSEHHIGPGGKVSCRIGIFVEDRGWVWKSDGAGETDIEGEKGSFSDAFKRAAVSWGIARDLYGETTQGQAELATRQPAPTAPQAVSPQPAAAVNDDGGTCPVHGYQWSLQPGGTSRNPPYKEYAPFWKCSGKDGARYCSEKPEKAWVARQERA